MLLIVFAIILFAGLPASATEHSIDSLLVEQRNLGALHDSLKSEQVRLASQADSMGVLISKLKAMDAEVAEVEELHEALRASLGLVEQLVQVDSQIKKMAVAQDSLKEQLGLAYDWEIGRLIQQLDKMPDNRLFALLERLQKARLALVEQGNGRHMRYGEEMAIVPEDGPGEIRQKIAWMEDMATRLKVDHAKVERRMSQLEEEGRLRAKVSTFTTQISFFDEHLPEGRVLRQIELRQEVVQFEPPPSGDDVSSARLENEPPSSAAAVIDMEEDSAPESIEGLQPVNQVAQEGGGPADGQMGVGEVALEIHRLKARQLELRQMRAVLQERIGAFHMHLEELLEGGE